MNKKYVKITNTEVSDWLDTFNGNDAEVLLTAIANNEIKTEVMNDSIYAFSVGETEIAEQCYKEMYRKGQKTNDLNSQIEIAKQELKVAKENLNQIEQHLFLLKAEIDQQKERKNVNRN